MNSLHLFLAIGVGVIGVIVMAVIWSLRRMPSEAEMEELHRQQCAQAVRDNAAPDVAVAARADSASTDR